MVATWCDLNDFVKAMEVENCRRILTLLQQEEMCVSVLVDHFFVTRPTITHHFAIHRRANMMLVRREGKNDYYRVIAECVAECWGEILNRLQILSRDIDQGAFSQKGNRDVWRTHSLE